MPTLELVVSSEPDQIWAGLEFVGQRRSLEQNGTLVRPIFLKKRDAKENKKFQKYLSLFLSYFLKLDN
jgi:hypothetical protein